MSLHCSTASHPTGITHIHKHTQPPPSPCLQSFSVEIAHEETLVTGQVAYLQAALLYTNSCGERRIRVHTLALPVVSGGGTA